ncbi:MAG: phosphodiesterase [Fervidobacterium sp.]|uniref:phosphodiesterase n=1 Tax=Fervidobacterium sp. TaxID=1871331 RepID=UPI0040496B7F
MKILVVSDTHGSVKAWEDIERLFNLKEFTSIFHLGDVLYHGPRNPLPDGYDPKSLVEKLKNYRINYIRGNCDADIDLKVLSVQEMPKVTMEYFGDFSFLLVHGEVFEENDIRQFVNDTSAQFIIHGHTHIPKIEEIDGKFVLNPGSTSLPKNGAPRSVMIVEINENKLLVKFYNLDTGEVYTERTWTLSDSKLITE